MQIHTVADVMSRAVVSVPPLAKVRDALRLADDCDICHLVVTQGGALLGIACVCQLREARPDLPVEKVMRSPVRSVGPDLSCEAAADILRELDLGCLPVEENGRLAGIVTRSDLAKPGDAFRLDLGETTCASCGAHHHVRPDRATSVGICSDCSERARASDDIIDTGGGD